MKPFPMKENHKKWILTTALLAVLGLNVSTPLFQQGVSADMASTTPDTKEDEFKFTDADRKIGQIKVQYIKQGGKTTAIVRGQDAEGRICTGDCDPRYYTLNKPFESSTKDLLDVLIQAMPMNGAQAVEPRDTKDTKDDRRRRTDDVAKDDKAEKAKRLLHAIRCTQSDNKGRGDCLVKGFIAVLRKHSDIDKSEAREFYQTEIRPVLIELGTEALNDDREVTGTSYNHTRAADMLRRLQSDIPKGFMDVRDEVTSTANEIVKMFANHRRNQQEQAIRAKSEAQTLQQQANLYQRSGQSDMAMIMMQRAQEAMFRANQFERRAGLESVFIDGSLIPDLRMQMNTGLNSAQQLQLITLSDMNTLQTRFDQRNQELMLQLQNRQLQIGPNGTTTLVTNGQGGVVRIIERNNGNIFGGPGSQGVNPGFGVPQGGTGTQQFVPVQQFAPARQFNPALSTGGIRFQ